MKTAKIVKRESVNGGAMITLSFTLQAGESMEDFDIQQVGGYVLNSGGRSSIGYVNTTESDLQVGDSITDEQGGEAIIANEHGNEVATEIEGKQADYRDAFYGKQNN